MDGNSLKGDVGPIEAEEEKVHGRDEGKTRRSPSYSGWNQ